MDIYIYMDLYCIASLFIALIWCLQGDDQDDYDFKKGFRSLPAG